MKSSLLASVAFVSTLLLRAADPLSEALQRGLLAEEAHRDLPAASAAYQEAVRLGDAQRSLVATALFRLAETERRQGRTNEAVVLYQRLLREYSDATNLTVLARRNLREGSAVGGDASAPPEAQRLLREEIVLAEQQLEGVQRRQQVGRADTDEVLKAQRDVLALQRQLASMQVRPVDLPASPTGESSDEESREILRLQRMLANSPDLLNAPQGADNETPLQTAAGQDQGRVVEYLLKAGADINALGSSGTTALYKAASAGHKRMVDLLLQAGAKVDARGEGKFTPLLGAVARERAQVIQTLLAAGASATIQSGNYGISTRNGSRTLVSPLGLAVNLGNRALVEQMIRGGADINAPSFRDQSFLENAISRWDWDIISLLVKLGFTPSLAQKIADGTLFQALVQGRTVQTAILDQVMARGGRLDVTNASGDTLLHLAIRAKATNAVPWLLAHGVDPDPVNQAGRSPLMDLVSLLAKGGLMEGEAQVLEGQLNALLALKVNVNRSPLNLRPPLVEMPWSLNTNVFTRLLAAGADPNTLNDDGQPLLMDFVLHDRAPSPPGVLNRSSVNLGMVRALLEAGADPNVGWGGSTPLVGALATRPEMVQLLLDFKADPNRRDGRGLTALEELANVRKGNLSSPDPQSQESLSQIEAILRAAGARDDVPDFGIIRMVRSSSGFAQVIFRRNGTNDSNRFTLLEALAAHYGVILGPRVPILNPGVSRASANIGRGGPPVVSRPAGLTFPDWRRVVIRRPEPDGVKWTEIPVDVDEIFAKGGCGRDLTLRWGDVIEVPERDHPVDEPGSWVPSELLSAWHDCLARSVTLTVGGKLDSRRLEFLMESGEITAGKDPFTLSGALSASRLLRRSSDTSRVLLRRTDPATGKSTEITVNCRDANGEGESLWLREGDEIVVPDLR